MLARKQIASFRRDVEEKFVVGKRNDRQAKQVSDTRSVNVCQFMKMNVTLSIARMTGWMFAAVRATLFFFSKQLSFQQFHVSDVSVTVPCAVLQKSTVVVSQLRVKEEKHAGC